MSGQQAGLRCATSAACLLSGLMCSLERVDSQVAPAQANMDEGEQGRGSHPG